MKRVRLVLFIVILLSLWSVAAPLSPSLAQTSTPDDNRTIPTTLHNMEWQVLAIWPEASVDATVPNGYGYATNLTVTWNGHHHEVGVFFTQLNENGNELYQANRSQWLTLLTALMNTALSATTLDHSGETLFVSNQETFLVRRDMTGTVSFGQKVGLTAYSGSITVENGHITYPDFFQPVTIRDEGGQLCAITFGAELPPTIMTTLETDCETVNVTAPNVVTFSQALPYAEVKLCFECFYPIFE